MTFHVKIEVECVNVDMEIYPAPVTIYITSKYYNPVSHYKPEISEKLIT